MRVIETLPKIVIYLAIGFLSHDITFLTLIPEDTYPKLNFEQ